MFFLCVFFFFNIPYIIWLTNHTFGTYAKKHYQRNVFKIINQTVKHFLYRNIVFKWLKNLDSYLKQENKIFIWFLRFLVPGILG